MFFCLYPTFKNLIYHFSTCMLYLLCNRLKSLYAYKELYLERALDEDTGVLFVSSHWARQLFLGIPPLIGDPGNLCPFLYLESLAFYATC